MSIFTVLCKIWIANLTASLKKLLPYKLPKKKDNKPKTTLVIGIGQRWRLYFDTGRNDTYKARISELPKVNENSLIWTNFNEYDYGGIEPEYMLFQLIYNKNFRTLGQFDKQFSRELTKRDKMYSRVLKIIARQIVLETESQEFINKQEATAYDFSTLNPKIQ